MSPTVEPDRVLIVGAGIAGLLSAHRLMEQEIPVLVFDKARGVGGRMSTRRIGAARLDHGAQFFTANEPAFQALVGQWVQSDAARHWTRGFADRAGEVRPDGRPTYRGVNGMNNVPKLLAEGLDVRTGCRLTSVARSRSGFEVQAENGECFSGRAVLLTAPVPQSLALVEAGGIELPAKIEEQLRSVEYDPCFAVLAVLSGPSAIPAPGGMKLENSPIEWMADNSAKGISPLRHAVTIHATAEYSRARLEDDPDRVGEELLAAAQPWLGSPVEEVQVHRWLYSRPKATSAERFLTVALGESGAPLVFAGDAFGGPAVEGAALSGLAAGEWLASRLKAGVTGRGGSDG